MASWFYEALLRLDGSRCRVLSPTSSIGNSRVLGCQLCSNTGVLSVVALCCARERVMMDWSQTEYLMLVRGIMLGVGSQVVGFLE